MARPDRVWCVVPAAGRGARFGASVPKQYVPLAGEPLLLKTLRRLAAMPVMAGLLVVLAPDDDLWPTLDLPRNLPLRTATGASERGGSVLAGLRALPDAVAAADFVLVHDAARPCVREDDVGRLLLEASAAGGGLLAAPLRDTLKRAGGDGHVDATESREARWRALTPQLFRRGELTAALEAAAREGLAVTDESMAMERAGHRPLLVEGSETNIKVTTPADLLLAEYLVGAGNGHGAGNGE
jgi:2-C-methyl-D-erythritol 4-phosphate cytidylyltransferase